MRIAYWILAALICAAGSPGQTPVTGGLTGTVTTRSGAGIPHATVRLTHSATSQTQTITTTSTGAFSFSSSLPEATKCASRRPASRLPACRRSRSTPPSSRSSTPLSKRAKPLNPYVAAAASPRPQPPTAPSSTHARSLPSPTTRNFTQIVSMTSGSAADVNSAGTLGRGTRSVNVNGNTSAGGYTLDGAFAPSAVPNPDTISVLKVQLSVRHESTAPRCRAPRSLPRAATTQIHGDVWSLSERHP